MSKNMGHVSVIENNEIYESTWSAQLVWLKKTGAGVDKAGKSRVVYVV
jgi:hypothetical protein